MNCFLKKSTRGFTLVEIVVYVAILAVISVLSINATLSMTRAFADLRVSRDLNSSATAFMERITRDVRAAYDVDEAQSTFGVNLSSSPTPRGLMLKTKDAAGANTTIEYFVSNGLVNITEGGVAQGAIMTASTNATSFIVREVINGTTKAVKVEATISATRGDITKQRNFYTTVVLRGTY